MAMTPGQAMKLEDIVAALSRAITCASDRHVDCRDEMNSHLDDAREMVEDLLDESREITE